MSQINLETFNVCSDRTFLRLFLLVASQIEGTLLARSHEDYALPPLPCFV